MIGLACSNSSPTEAHAGSYHYSLPNFGLQRTAFAAAEGERYADHPVSTRIIRSYSVRPSTATNDVASAS